MQARVLASGSVDFQWWNVRQSGPRAVFSAFESVSQRRADFEKFLGKHEQQLPLYIHIYVCVHMYICILFDKSVKLLWGLGPHRIISGGAWALEPPHSRRRCMRYRPVRFLPISAVIAVLLGLAHKTLNVHKISVHWRSSWAYRSKSAYNLIILLLASYYFKYLLLLH